LLHIVLALVAIGLALFLWERFPAFKWIVAVCVGGVALIVLILFGISAQKKSEREAEERKGAEIQRQNQELVTKQRQEEVRKKIDEGEDPLTVFLREVEKREKDSGK
jgi:hypothetical protein